MSMLDPTVRSLFGVPAGAAIRALAAAFAAC
jgi:hypothetical protein